MTPIRIFISSVQKEFSTERKALRDYLRGDALMRRFFEPFLFEDVPASLTLEKLRHPHASVPGNPLLAEPLYLTRYIERMGTGIGDMIRRCKNAGLPEPEFALTDGFVNTIRRPDRKITGTWPGFTPPADEVTDEVIRLLQVLQGEMARTDLQMALLLKGETNFRKLYLGPALQTELIEMTVPDKPNSRFQKYRLTSKGRIVLASSKKGKSIS